MDVTWAQPIELVVDGNPHPLSSEQAEVLAEKATEYVKSCWLSNLEIRAGNGKQAFAPDWARERSQNHLRIDFDSPLAVSTVDGTTMVQSVLVSLHLGQVLGLNRESEFSLLKCSPRKFNESGCLDFLDGLVHDVPQALCPNLLKIEDYVVENHLDILTGIYEEGSDNLLITDGLNLLEKDDKALLSEAFKEGHVSIVG